MRYRLTFSSIGPSGVSRRGGDFAHQAMVAMGHMLAFASLLLMAPFCWGEEPPASPEILVKRFYEVCLETRPSGLPTEAELKILLPYFSFELTALFVSARKYQADYRKRHPDDKPPLIEGDLFSSLFEGPTGFEVGPVEEMDQRSKVTVRFSYVDPNAPKDVFRWKDAVIVRRRGNRLVIEDIEFLGDWPFKIGIRLSEVLKNLK